MTKAFLKTEMKKKTRAGWGEEVIVCEGGWWNILTISRVSLAGNVTGEPDSVQEKESGDTEGSIQLCPWQTLQGVDDDLVACGTCAEVIVCQQQSREI